MIGFSQPQSMINVMHLVNSQDNVKQLANDKVTNFFEWHKFKYIELTSARMSKLIVQILQQKVNLW